MPVTSGSKLGPYEILCVAGEGGMGTVYKARDTRLDRTVALKTLHPGRPVSEEMRQRFQAEARAIARLNHPHVCMLHDVGQDAGVDYLVLEFVDAKPLDRMIPKGGLRLDEVLSIGWQVADAVAAAHKAGIVHRDLKPGNVMVNEHGQVKVLDFGLAKIEEIAQARTPVDDRTLTQATPTSEGTILGTVSYMSPEQAEGKTLDARSDIFSFGVLLYEMTTGRRPFAGDTRVATMAAILNQEPAALGEDIPAEFRRLVERCLRKAPGRRIQHMDDARLVLEDLKEDSTSGRLTVPASAAKSARTWSGKWIAAGGLAALAIAGGAWWRTSNATPRDAAPAARKLTPLTALPGREISPSFSPDGSQVAFSWTGEDRKSPGIHIKVVGAEKPLRLTTGRDSHAAWSPDGRWIGFTRVSQGTASYLAIPPTGGPERRLAETEYGLGVADSRWMSLCWMPDSRGVILTEGGGGDAPGFLSHVSLESGQRTRLTNPQAPLLGDSGPALSADGSLLAFTRSRRFGEGDIFLQQLNGVRPVGEPRRLTNPPGQFTAPVFLPDGKELIFRSVESKHGSGLFRIALNDPSSVIPLGLPDATDASLSRDGTRLAFAKGCLVLGSSNLISIQCRVIPRD